MNIQSCAICKKEASLRAKGWHRLIIKTADGCETYFFFCPVCKGDAIGTRTITTEITGKELRELLS